MSEMEAIFGVLFPRVEVGDSSEVADPVGDMFQKAQSKGTSDEWDQEFGVEIPEVLAKTVGDPMKASSKKGRVRLLPIEIDGEQFAQTFDHNGVEGSLIPIR